MNKRILITVLCNLCILVAIGHGGAPLGLTIPVLASDILDGNFSFQLTGSYNKRLPATILIAFFGQIILLIACLMYGIKKTILAYAGLIFLYTSLFIMAIDFKAFSVEGHVFLFAFPFIFSSCALLYFILTQKTEAEDQWNYKK